MKKKASTPPMKPMMKSDPMPSDATALQQRLNAAMRTPAAQRGSKMKRT